LQIPPESPRISALMNQYQFELL
jgi:hypothetical protein